MEEIEEFLNHLVDEYNLPSISCGIYTDGEKGTVTVGRASIEEGEAATEKTRYCIGSCTKSFTALAILRLCDEGKLDLEDSPTDYIEGLPSEFGEITLEHLLSHSSGIPSDSMAEVIIEEEFGAESYGFDLKTSQDFLDYLNSNTVSSRFSPGERKLYYNSGYTLLGMVIAEVSGRSYEEFVVDEMLSSMNLVSAGFNFSSDDDNVSVPYRISGEGVHEKSYPEGFPFNPAGGLFIDARDAARYISYLVEGRFNDSGISESWARKLTEPRIPADPGASVSNDGSYCLGLYSTDFLGRKVYCHGGVVQSSSAGIAFDGQDGAMVMVNSNTPFYPSNIAFAVYSILKGKSPEEVPFFSLNRKFRSLEGLYSDQAGVWEFRVEEDHPHLLLSLQSEVTDFETKLEPDGHEPGNLRFWNREENGRRSSSPVQFEEEDGSMVFYYLGHRFQRTS